MTPAERCEAARLAGERHGRLCAVVALEQLPGATEAAVDLWLWHYRNVVIRDELAERLAAGASAVECAVFTAGSLAGLVRDLDEAAAASAEMAGVLRAAIRAEVVDAPHHVPGGTPWEKAHWIRATLRVEALRAANDHLPKAT